jgi:hypothetical protein
MVHDAYTKTTLSMDPETLWSRSAQKEVTYKYGTKTKQKDAAIITITISGVKDPSLWLFFFKYRENKYNQSSK